MSDKDIPTTKAFRDCPKCGRMPTLEIRKRQKGDRVAYYWWKCPKCNWERKGFPTDGATAEKVRSLEIRMRS